ncbi:MAG: ABC transporter ATP-binding protein [Clostridia bacterium]|nr:ABC transporter ATP-binding protein [Clostridia bacterium]
MNALDIKNLTKSYPGFMLDHLNLTLPSGCIMGLIGENGAGKSTTIKLILDMIRKDGGSIAIFGKDNGDRSELIKEDVGVVLDEVGIPECLTVKQVANVMKHTFHNWDDDEYARLIQKLALPNQKQFKEFSRGMKTKLGIAIALSHHAKLLILDEATSGLDPVVRDEVVELFSDFTRDESHSILISSHIVSDLEKLCDYISFLHKGKLLLCEEKDQLLAEYGLIHCTIDELLALPAGAVKHKKENAYGVEAMVLRNAVPSGIHLSPISIEELFVFMAKEAK